MLILNDSLKLSSQLITNTIVVVTIFLVKVGVKVIFYSLFVEM